MATAAAAARRCIAPGQIGITVILAGRVHIDHRHAAGDVARHVEVRVADILVVENAVAGANHCLGVRRVRDAKAWRKIHVLGIQERTIGQEFRCCKPAPGHEECWSI